MAVDLGVLPSVLLSGSYSHSVVLSFLLTPAGLHFCKLNELSKIPGDGKLLLISPVPLPQAS